MPTYNFECKHCKLKCELVMPASERGEPIACLEQFPTAEERAELPKPCDGTGQLARPVGDDGAPQPEGHAKTPYSWKV